MVYKPPQCIVILVQEDALEGRYLPVTLDLDAVLDQDLGSVLFRLLGAVGVVERADMSVCRRRNQNVRLVAAEHAAVVLSPLSLICYGALMPTVRFVHCMMLLSVMLLALLWEVLRICSGQLFAVRVENLPSAQSRDTGAPSHLCSVVLGVVGCLHH